MNYKQLYQQAQVSLYDTITRLNTNPLLTQSIYNKNYTNLLVSKDRIMCSMRYIWKNLPFNLTSRQLESFFYKYKSLAFFQGDEGQLLIGTFSESDKLQPFGKLTKIRPIDFAGKSYNQEFTIVQGNGMNTNIGEKLAVVISDFTDDYNVSLSNSRMDINLKTTIADEVMTYSQLNTNIKLSIHKALALCETEEQMTTMVKQVDNILNANSCIVPILKNGKNKGMTDLPLEMWNMDNNFNTQNYCQQIDYYNKVRRTFDGIPAPDTFEKKERKITSENENTNVHTLLVLDDGYYNRLDGLNFIKQYMPTVENIKKTNVEINPLLKPIEKSDNDNDIPLKSVGEKNE